MEKETLFSFNHIILVGGMLVPLLAIWYDNRRQNNKHHKENIELMSEMKTKVNAMWQWWCANGK